MTPYYSHGGINIHVGNCLDIMPTLAADSVDAIVTDPPYHLTTGKRGGSGAASDNPDSPAGRARIGTGFMGKAWDGGDVAFRVETWEAAYRVLKPGAHLVAFGGTRTFHRLTCAIEDAGFEIRDCLSWLYGSGFPKSLDVSKAMDKAAGAEREVTGRMPEWKALTQWRAMEGRSDLPDISERNIPATDAARQWDGWGTALKPAWEPIILARKPLIGTVASNVLAHGTGALNIDGCRIGTEPAFTDRAGQKSVGGLLNTSAESRVTSGGAGRWPANVCLDEDAAAALDEQSGQLTSGNNPAVRHSPKTRDVYGLGFGDQCLVHRGTDSGGASRFFYTAKAGRGERNAGVHLTAQQPDAGRDPDAPGGNNPRNRGAQAVANHHPTVKPLALMQWLCRLVTPKGGIILDPFMGSGSTGRAAIAEGFDFTGIELSEEYAEIARARIADYAPLFAGGVA